MIYLDNAATTFPKPPEVVAEMTRCMTDLGANPGRASHRMATEVERQITETRQEIASFFGFKRPERVIYTHNCTDALNFALKGALGQGDHVITTAAAHNSVSRPLEQMIDDGRLSLTRVPIDSQGMVDPDDVIRAIRPDTRLVEITHGSNVTGSVQSLEELCRRVRELDGPLILVDAAQTGGILPINMDELGIDLLALPGHKGLFGPPGTGILLVSERTAVRPWREGGTGGDSANRTQPRELPYYWESGTLNTVGIVGLRAGLAFVRKTGLEAIFAHERRLMTRLIDAFKDDERLTLYGPGDPYRQVGVFSFKIAGMDIHETGAYLDARYQIAIRTGLHCAPYIHKAIGSFDQGGTARISLSVMNTVEEIETTIAAIKELAASV
jgi:cysteine desulfurase family protein